MSNPADIKRLFNYGYLIQTYDPDLAEKLKRGMRDDKDTRLQALTAGMDRSALDYEQRRTRRYKIKPAPAAKTTRRKQKDTPDKDKT